ncbi:iron-containing alcohol dehydrogenase [Accumulibacter sp.]|uniref:iron-containing alcohol dehydrogenase n=1 Tax=Accumulibacter sp. TaxID=2053492 RepID=UPI0025D5E3B0|nr:iron-containing alcohol dehydrogenase [Accumulibacter sp.]MCM8594315.1 iron-containing alcohol dehydrogenase [Accumulibacter sp.]MCM8625050.1 iron-containing alcohol dehydrogenase [Accumulibacter sp.]MDS4048459.1 iron-containing alcohol dehydrogenase [Accumulibacter sp.]
MSDGAGRFSIGRLPRIEFGSGAIARLPEIAAGYGRRLLLVTGARSFVESAAGERLFAAFRQRGLDWQRVGVSGEPSPEFVNQAVASFRASAFDAVVGVGGGSALDAAKAIAGLLRTGNPVEDHLEGVGPELPYRGPATPFIAVPTTAGTGSEATRNAVLSAPGGFKKSFRDEQLVAEWAIVDPDLLASCPPELIAADGLDAFTQLLESFVSLRANPVTDALARSGIMAARDALPALHRAQSAAARAQMAYASLTSGICLAQAGLGAVHGLASPLGALFPIPHGVVCGTLVASATAGNIAALEAREPDNPALPKYAEIGRRFAMQKGLNGRDARRFLVDTLRRWEEELALPRLSAYGIAASDLPRIVAASRGSSMKTNPVVLGDDELTGILASRL